MTVEELQELLDGDSNMDEFLKFDRVVGERRLSNRPDLCAFLLLDSLVPGTSDMVSAAEHDQIWLDVDLEKLAAVITREDVDTLRRCGVVCDSETESLFMFA
jgi:hypothetical protein